jgi:hypothetical protein
MITYQPLTHWSKRREEEEDGEDNGHEKNKVH